VTAYLDGVQASLHERFPGSHYLGDERHASRLMEWITFYRRNVNRFVEHYFGLRLHLYQKIILSLMGGQSSFCMVAARATAKSYIIAVYACARAVLYPNSQIIIASKTKGQSRLIVSSKIKNELMRDSGNLTGEIKNIVDNSGETVVYFHNGSTIKVVPAGEQARGNRGTVMIYEEFRQILKSVADTILSPILFVRQAPYLKLPEYEARAVELQEEPVEIYISTGWLQSHWMWGLMKSFLNDQLKTGSSCVICMDYAVTLRHGIRTRKQLIRERKKLDPISWAIEYENKMISQNARAYFSYDILGKNQKLVKAFYPRINSDYVSRVKNKYALPKLEGEVRIVSCDIAMIEGSANDNSVFSCIRLLPEGTTRSTSDATGEHVEFIQGYRRQVPYLEACQGGHTEKQAIRIKQLFEDFSADYCVLDIQNAGVSVYDSLAKVLYDEDRDVEYRPWTCMNDAGITNRIQISGAMPVVYAVSASAKLNSEIAVSMRECLSSEKIDLLIHHSDAIDEIAKRVPEYSECADLDAQLFYEHPFLETSALIGEMMSLEYEIGEATGIIRVKEQSGMRKDRYTSVSYGNYFAGLLERDMFFDSSDYEFIPMFN
jgi:hypothetical protein